ncbi:hypothetical protein BAOM_3513 [Peribacillus asahii]|uniref:Uncharacterized protein n=1 Tax=Peribacillus asahii TaxID=228899 RepID=A0A3T0KUL4_9BACI|nr:hypothetical protein BAOM_3513 [Peribacillus asahii]
MKIKTRFTHKKRESGKLEGGAVLGLHLSSKSDIEELCSYTRH